MSSYQRVLVLPGDGIGPEVLRQAVRILVAVGNNSGVEFELDEAIIGGRAIDETGHPLPPETMEMARNADAILLGAVGGPKWDTTDPNAPRPEQGLLAIRKNLRFFANLRPVRSYGMLIDASPLRKEISQDIDLLVVRELTGGIYFGKSGRSEDGDSAFDTCTYTRDEIERVARVAFDLAGARRGSIHNVDKANVLESSRLWREVVMEVAADYPDITVEHHLVDNAAMQLIRQPSQYDVILTENLFGDILSDEASMLTGSIGMLPSASLTSPTSGAAATAGSENDETGAPVVKRRGLYEPIHGSAPDIAGKGIANPLAAILSVAMMYRYSFGIESAAVSIETAVEGALAAGYRTADLADGMTADECEAAGMKPVGTVDMGTAVMEALA